MKFCPCAQILTIIVEISLRVHGIARARLPRCKFHVCVVNRWVNFANMTFKTTKKMKNKMILIGAVAQIKTILDFVSFGKIQLAGGLKGASDRPAFFSREHMAYKVATQTKK